MEEIKTVDLYLVSSLGNGTGGFSALLAYRSKNKMVFGTYDYVRLVEVLLLALSEAFN